MNSPERVYALLVEANPIPEPQAVPPLPSPVLLNERRSVMLTQEPTETKQIVARPRWPRAMVAFAATVVVIGAAAVMWAIGTDDGPVAAGDARIEVTFTGDGTSYVGHREIFEGITELTLINQGETTASFVVQRFDTGSVELAENLALAAEGGDFLTEDLPPGMVDIYEVLPAASGASPATPSILLEPGTYILDAGLGSDEIDGTHVYRAAVITVVAD